ncbi:phosphoribosylformylglycinamidine synthase [Anoxynatronum buryatiense]|uniref:Phosphoribosylformylglycinamidine synthase n=1 Tax=Anoxynatronum buryatiense TaxID=489973 RepID=A0AA45WTS7_9CLOT|nr:phosphoribosylformylglycinamidine synthase [Anoxynatronum buryatiense]SMP44146.1 phosphoribosylformylglycinamidine synthase [Anoxynatronum buryatiense]
MGVKRVFVEKKEAFQAEAQQLFEDLRDHLKLTALCRVRVLNRYDVEGIDEITFEKALSTIFAEPPLDDVYVETFPVQNDDLMLAVELLPGQYDQRADSAAQCIQLLTQEQRPDVTYAKVMVFEGDLTSDDLSRISDYLINPVESRKASLEKPKTLKLTLTPPEAVAVLSGFTTMTASDLADFAGQYGLAMSVEDLAFCQTYFSDTEKRDPSITEIRMIDTYWSDHCRHTTFLTEITQVDFENDPLNQPAQDAWQLYQQKRLAVYGDDLSEKPACLMDLAVIAMKEMRRAGKLDDLEVSDEINACSIIVPADIDGRQEDWLVMFKNETHNHPTEIEPFGGAATCLGGAIRDPLSGRSYVYQAMRITGSGDPRTPLEKTLPGKLPQRKITQEASHGYSSYGNQIGLATGYVKEYYHERFVAKRMELGAVIGAAPKSQVMRASSDPGDVIVLVGGRTGRDGCGGATGSSKEHDETSLSTCGAEVQKGNAPTERKIQRLFRDPAVSRLIKKCNDFGAGGVSVAIGELADGLFVDLDQVPRKYEGLDGTELAISESQERMAVVLDPADETAFIAAAQKENLEAVRVAVVTESPRLVMNWQGTTIVDIARSFLDTNGVKQQTTMKVPAPFYDASPLVQLPENLKRSMAEAPDDLHRHWMENLSDLNVCSQKGLIEKFDSTIGAATSLMPLGGIHQLTPAEGMAARLPVLQGNTTTVTGMTAGYHPDLACWSPFHGAYYAVMESLCRLAAMGFSTQKARLTLQEYFEKPGDDPVRWGRPLAALLGAYTLQQQLEIPAIGGKDSMSGTFKDLDVPPTLVSFAVAAGEEPHLCSPEFKEAGHPVVWLRPQADPRTLLLDSSQMKTLFEKLYQLIGSHRVLAAKTVGLGGVSAALSQMCFGNRVGFQLQIDLDLEPPALFLPAPGNFLLEMTDEEAVNELLETFPGCLLGHTIETPEMQLPDKAIPLDDLLKAWQEPLEDIFPTNKSPEIPKVIANAIAKPASSNRPLIKTPRPRVVIPTFPGTNCEMDTLRALERAGADAELLIFRNLSANAIDESVQALAAAIHRSQMVVLPGGFSAGDEPDGSGKFITVVFRNPLIQDAVHQLLKERDGLMLGICNGFQALIKLGLVPYGEIRPPHEAAPTLTFNTLGRHVSGLIRTRVASSLSPWFAGVTPGQIHTLPVSHGEGRFIAPEETIGQLMASGQVAAQYVDLSGQPAMALPHNPNGSMGAIEALTSPDGRVLGKMAHSERCLPGLYRNVPGDYDQKILESGVKYYR